MLHVQLDEEVGIVTLIPEGQLKKSDFENVSALVDPVLERLGSLAGLIISVEEFPGWESFGALASHLTFIKDHHRHIKRIAFVTDSPIGGIAEKVGRHFISAEIKDFGYAEWVAARDWVLGGLS